MIKKIDKSERHIFNEVSTDVKFLTYVQRPIYFRLRPISVVIDFDYDPEQF